MSLACVGPALLRLADGGRLPLKISSSYSRCGPCLRHPSATHATSSPTTVISQHRTIAPSHHRTTAQPHNRDASRPHLCTPATVHCRDSASAYRCSFAPVQRPRRRSVVRRPRRCSTRHIFANRDIACSPVCTGAQPHRRTDAQTHSRTAAQSQMCFILPQGVRHLGFARSLTSKGRGEEGCADLAGALTVIASTLRRLGQRVRTIWEMRTTNCASMHKCEGA